MEDHDAEQSHLRELTTRIISAHVAHNSVTTGDLIGLITSVHASLARLGQPAEQPVARREPAVPIKKSVTADKIFCLECGRAMKMLKRHLQADHGLTPQEYRTKWGLAHDYPMVTPTYAATRQELAKKIGLGRKPQEPAKPAGRKPPRRKAAAA